MKVQFKLNHPLAQVPEYKTSGAVAFDIAIVEDAIIEPRQMTKIRTGLVVNVPNNHALLIISRSSNPMKKGIDLANSVGVIDSDYCGPNDELKLLVENITDEIVELKAGDRIAQGLFTPVSRPSFEQVEEMEAPDRGGFGTTGQ